MFLRKVTKKITSQAEFIRDDFVEILMCNLTRVQVQILQVSFKKKEFENANVNP